MTDVSPLLLGTDFAAEPAGEFTAGPGAGAAGSPWRLRPVPGFPQGDGAASTGPDGLTVQPTATHPHSGEPAFAAPPGGFGNDGDHLRWAMLADHDTPGGMPGFSLGDDDHLRLHGDLAVRGFGLDRPEAREVSADPERDLRLGAAAMILMDRESGLVFDFVVTHRRVFAVYERLAFPGTAHAGFTYAVPVLDHEPDQGLSLTIAYDHRDRATRWLVAGEEVLVVRAPGLRLTTHERFRLRDNGKPDEPAAPRQLTCGVGLFTDEFVGQGIRLTVRRLSLEQVPGTE